MNSDSTTETGGSGLSRRDMIKASVVAGALVWSAPLLLTGRAAADPPADHCCDGTPVTVKIDLKKPNDPVLNGEQDKLNFTCQGSACLTDRAMADGPGGFEVFLGECQEFVDCLQNPVLDLLEVVEFVTDRPGDTAGGGAEIRLLQNVTLVSAAVHTQGQCWFTDCLPGFATGPNSGVPNTCSGTGCATALLPNQNRIFVETDMGQQIVRVEIPAAPGEPGPLNHIQLTVCVASELTPFC